MIIVTPVILTLLFISPTFGGVPSDINFFPSLQNQYKGHVIAYLIIVGGLWMFTVIVFIIVTITLIKRCCQANAASVSFELKKEVIIIMTLLVLLGVPWITAIFVQPLLVSIPEFQFSTNLLIGQVMTIITSTQGFSLFALQCLRLKIVRKKWKKLMCNICSRIRNTVYKMSSISRHKETTV